MIAIFEKFAPGLITYIYQHILPEYALKIQENKLFIEQLKAEDPEFKIPFLNDDYEYSDEQQEELITEIQEAVDFYIRFEPNEEQLAIFAEYLDYYETSFEKDDDIETAEAKKDDKPETADTEIDPIFGITSPFDLENELSPTLFTSEGPSLAPIMSLKSESLSNLLTSEYQNLISPFDLENELSPTLFADEHLRPPSTIWELD